MHKKWVCKDLRQIFFSVIGGLPCSTIDTHAKRQHFEHEEAIGQEQKLRATN
jgi:hypothetical protein